MNYYKFFLAGVVSICGTFVLNAASVSISIDGNGSIHKVSPYVYGKNNSTSDDSSKATTQEEWTRINESGVAFLRENSGNIRPSTIIAVICRAIRTGTIMLSRTTGIMS